MPKKIVIIGAGPAGAYAAYRMKQLGHEVTLLEKASHPGGMCSTYIDPITGQRTERGAVLISPNYPLEIFKDLGIKPKVKLPLPPTETQIIISNARYYQKFKMGTQYLRECARFAWDVYRYRSVRDAGAPLPEDLKKPFSEYIEAHGIEISLDLYKGFIPGCGYGSFEDVPTWWVLEYLGYTTVPFATLPNGLKEVEGGYQGLVDAMAQRADRLITSANVTQITRDPAMNEGGVSVTYQVGDESHTIEADDLILAVPPHQYDKLGMDTSDAEKRCAADLKQRPYPVAICKIKGMPENYHFFFDVLNKKTFPNQVSLITTRDPRNAPEDGRLCTVYFNTNEECDIDFNDHDALATLIQRKISSELGDTIEVEVLEAKQWQDYARYLPYDTRLEMAKEQGVNHTYYLGAPFGFDDVGCTIDFAKRLINKKFAPKPESFFQRLTQTANNLSFYHSPETTAAENPELDGQQQLAYGVR